MRTSAWTVVTVATLGLAVAGCSDNPVVNTPSTPGGTGTAAPPERVASCLVGDWHTTAADAQARGAGAAATLTGGAGVAVKITDMGEVTVDFSDMQPAEFTVQVAGTRVRGQFSYTGQATGTVRTGPAAAPGATATATAGSATATPGVTTPGATTPGATISPSAAASLVPSATAGASGDAATSGTWEPVPPIEWGEVRVTVDLTEPVQARPFDNVRIGEVVGGGVDQTGNVVDVNPLFGRGRYECRGDTLTITPADDGGLGWTLSRG